MLEYGLPHMDQLVFIWVKIIKAINDTLDSFDGA